MGLDMYLFKSKGKKDYTLQELKNFSNQISRKEEGEPYSELEQSLIDKGIVSKQGEYIEWYSAFSEIGYWRKANHIHEWFVKNVQNEIDDCDYYEVSKTQIQTLLELCKEVDKHSILVDGKITNGQRFENGDWVDIKEDGKYIEDPTVANALLPTSSGFFFGNTDYNEFYLDDIKYTITLLEEVLDTFDFENDYLVYSSSW